MDHALRASNALSVIQSEKWEYVVLQLGPTSTQLNRDTLGKDARSLPARAIAGGRTLDTEETTIRLLQRIAHETSEQFPT